jgi:hypothetical protein
MTFLWYHKFCQRYQSQYHTYDIINHYYDIDHDIIVQRLKYNLDIKDFDMEYNIDIVVLDFDIEGENELRQTSMSKFIFEGHQYRSYPISI